MTSEAVDYQQLSAALRDLGFQKTASSTHTVFSHAASDAVIILPPESPAHPLRPLHVAAARATVVGKGVATAEAFDSALAKAAQLRRLRARESHQTETAASPKGQFGFVSTTRAARTQAGAARAAAKKKAKSH